MMPRVLLIEDDPIVARPTVRVLARAGACHVDWVPDPASAVARCEQDRYDFLVSDFDLGPLERTGVELLDELRTTHPDATCICISASPRDVPAWVAFVNKMDLASEMATAIDRWMASG